MMPAANCELHNKINMKLTRIQTATTEFTHLYLLQEGWLLLAIDIYIWHIETEFIQTVI